jgi:urease accessory protein
MQPWFETPASRAPHHEGSGIRAPRNRATETNLVLRSEAERLASRRMAAGALSLLLVILASPAFAHSGGSVVGGFAGGFAHPLFGPDHIVAMVAVGLWGAFLGAPAIWLLPIVFPLVMALGGVIGILGIAIPWVETGIALSAIVLGLMVAFGARPPLIIAAALVGAFAIFHGHAHGTELPPGADAVAYSVGFVVATGLLHLIGIGFGALTRWPAGQIAVRATGGAIAIAGLMFLGIIG